MEQYVIDTHALLWYVTADNRIGLQAKAILDRAEAGEVKIILPAIVLIEALDIIKKQRVVYETKKLLRWVEQIPYCEIKSLDWNIITLYEDFDHPNLQDSHDKIIIITAQFFGNIPIVTKDKDVQKIYSSTIW